MSDAPAPPPPPTIRSRVVQPLQMFLGTESAGGVLLLAAALVALVWANSPWGAAYERLWSSGDLRIGPGPALDLRHLVNDALMALFFLVVGLEIKRELVLGELRDRRAAALPAIAAIGGMVVPALIYLALNAGSAAARGWGIPMATDIAFAVGVLSLAARSAPPGLKSFLLTLAIVDDIGAIAVIAIVYADGVGIVPLVVAAALAVSMPLLHRAGVRTPAVHIPLAAAIWVAAHASGVHATIAGVAIGLLTPSRAIGDREPPVLRIEALLHPWTSFLIVPLFALANAGVRLTADGLAGAIGSPVTLGVLLGLVVGKAVGVPLAAALAARAGIGRLPEGVTWRGVLGVAAVAGIGFTVALFVAELAFVDPAVADEARVGILAASLLAGAFGFALLRRLRP